MRHLMLTACIAGLAAMAPSICAGVIVVSPSQSLTFAVNDAADGDTILVQGGTYDWSDITIYGKSLSILRSDPAATVQIKGTCRVGNLSASQTVLLHGLGIQGKSPTSYGWRGLEVTSCAGKVLIEECDITGGTGWTLGPLSWPPTVGAVISNCACVCFSSCKVTGGSAGTCLMDDLFGPKSVPGLQMDGSTVYGFRSTFTGGSGGAAWYDGVGGGFATVGGSGIQCSGGLLFAPWSLLKGGVGGTGLSSPGIHAGNGGAALNHSGGSVKLQLTSLSPGAGGQGGPPGGGPGAVITGSGPVEYVDGSPSVFTLDSPVREGQVSHYGFETVGDQSAVLMWSLGLQNVWKSSFHGAVLVGSPINLVFLGNTGSDGHSAWHAVLGQLPVGVQCATIYFQSVIIGSGGAKYVGNVQSQVIVDSMY